MTTIRDLKLDPDTLDLAVENGDLVLIEDADVVAQQIRIRLRRQLGEWYLDTTSGIDWLDLLSEKDPPVSAALRTAIEGVSHVRRLVDFTATSDASARSYTLTCTVETDFGDVTVTTEAP